MNTHRATTLVPAMDGELAYPRKNGEPVFEAPWQSRAFGMVVGLHKAGLYPWDEFKELLIDEIAAGPCAAARPGRRLRPGRRRLAGPGRRQ